jgi:hypothetical protein
MLSGRPTRGTHSTVAFARWPPSPKGTLASGGRQSPDQSPDQLAAERTNPVTFVARCPCLNGFPCCGANKGLTSPARLLMLAAATEHSHSAAEPL